MIACNIGALPASALHAAAPSQMRLWRQRTLSSAPVSNSSGVVTLATRLTLCCHSSQAASHAKLTGFRAHRPADDVPLAAASPPSALAQNMSHEQSKHRWLLLLLCITHEPHLGRQLVEHSTVCSCAMLLVVSPDRESTATWAFTATPPLKRSVQKHSLTHLLSPGQPLAHSVQLPRRAPCRPAARRAAPTAEGPIRTPLSTATTANKGFEDPRYDPCVTRTGPAS